MKPKYIVFVLVLIMLTSIEIKVNQDTAPESQRHLPDQQGNPQSLTEV